jgi:hypothetical protein
VHRNALLCGCKVDTAGAFGKRIPKLLERHLMMWAGMMMSAGSSMAPTLELTSSISPICKETDMQLGSGTIHLSSGCECGGCQRESCQTLRRLLEQNN